MFCMESHGACGLHTCGLSTVYALQRWWVTFCRDLITFLMGFHIAVPCRWIFFSKIFRGDTVHFSWKQSGNTFDDIKFRDNGVQKCFCSITEKTLQLAQIGIRTKHVNMHTWPGKIMVQSIWGIPVHNWVCAHTLQKNGVPQSLDWNMNSTSAKLP